MTGKSSTTIPSGSTYQDDMEKVALFHFYILRDPTDNKIKYVGRTVDLVNRFRNHIYEAKKFNRNKRERWIKSLLRRNMEPILERVYTRLCTLREAISIEKMLVKKIGARFELKNSPDNFLGAVLTGTQVFQYSTETGELLATFANSNQAYINTSVKDCNILRCCKNENGYGCKTAGGYFWSFIKYKKYPHKYLKEWRNKKGKPVLQYSLSGDLLNEFVTARVAEKITGVSYKKISAVCSGRQNTAGGYIWKLK